MLAAKPSDLRLEEIKGIGSSRAGHLYAVLKANKSGKHTPVPASYVPKKVGLEVFIDYEWLSDINVDFTKDPPNLDGCEMLFQVGAGFWKRGKWIYRQFVAAEESHKAELKMLKEFQGFLEEIGVFDPAKKAVCYHFAPAEPQQTERAIERHGTALTRLASINWFDLLKEVFHAVPVAIPGAWSFGLKDISAALSAYAPDHANEWEGGIGSGQNAQIAGWIMYRQEKPLLSKEYSMLSLYLVAPH